MEHSHRHVQLGPRAAPKQRRGRGRAAPRGAGEEEAAAAAVEFGGAAGGQWRARHEEAAHPQPAAGLASPVTF